MAPCGGFTAPVLVLRRTAALAALLHVAWRDIPAFLCPNPAGRRGVGISATSYGTLVVCRRRLAEPGLFMRKLPSRQSGYAVVLGDDKAEAETEPELEAHHADASPSAGSSWPAAAPAWPRAQGRWARCCGAAAAGAAAAPLATGRMWPWRPDRLGAPGRGGGGRGGSPVGSTAGTALLLSLNTSWHVG